MKRPERAVVFVLRLVGVCGMCALPAVIMPSSWMSAMHAAAGLGELPDAPIVGYLARSLSAFYAFNGAIALYLSFDVPRFRPVIQLVAMLFTIMGFVLLGVDLFVGMPLLWTLGEVPATIAIGGVLLWLLRDSRLTVDGSQLSDHGTVHPN